MADKLPDLSTRADYEWGTLDEADVGDDPIATLTRWLADAEASGDPNFNAMVVATVGADGQPTARNVLLRGIDEQGRLEFFTNRDSRKGRELAANPRVGLLFDWMGLHRQVRVDGTAEPLDDAGSDEYFDTRPRGSRISAWASRQSEVVADRSVLEAAMAEQTAHFDGLEVPRPPHWGGYAVAPGAIEFWQGRPSRLHDRLRFRRDASSPNGWLLERLSP